jgi:transposase-like protein/IS1 family transposase
VSRKRSETDISCQIPECEYYLTLDGKDIVKNGHNSAGNQQFFCKNCGKYFSETKNTPFYRSRLPRSTVELLFRLLLEKMPIRGIFRTLNLHIHTVLRYLIIIGKHAELINKYYLNRIAIGDIELDEIWEFIFKKEKNLEDLDCEIYGDYWVYTAVKRDSKLLIALKGGKRTIENCKRVLNLVFERVDLPTPENPIRFFSDGNISYVDVIASLYCEPCVEYGQIIKEKENNRISRILKTAIFGKPEHSTISTSVVESLNNKIRQKISRFGRKTDSFSKTEEGMEATLSTFQFASNFLDTKEGKTPMMIEGITDKPWTPIMFLNHHYQF